MLPGFQVLSIHIHAHRLNINHSPGYKGCRVVFLKLIVLELLILYISIVINNTKIGELGWNFPELSVPLTRGKNFQVQQRQFPLQHPAITSPCALPRVVEPPTMSDTKRKFILIGNMKALSRR